MLFPLRTLVVMVINIRNTSVELVTIRIIKMIFNPKKAILAAICTIVLGFIAIPVYADAATTTVSSAISPVISLFTTNGTVNINALPTSGGVQTIASDTVTISTNDSAGYTLQLGETTSTTSLTSGGNTIPAISGTFASPIAETANTWGYRVDGDGGFGAGPTSAASNASIGAIKFAAIAASGSPDTLTTTSSTASNATTTVWYGVAVNTAQASGTYTNSVTYTATTR